MASSQLRSLLLPTPPPSPLLSPHRAPREAHHRRSSAPPPPFSAISATSLRSPLHGGRAAAASELELALFAFTREPKLSPFHYNSLIRALNRAGLPGRALSVFVQMLHDPGSPPDRFTLPFVLKSCAQLGAIEEGEQIHGLVVKIHVVSAKDDGGASLDNALIHMYGQCGRIDLASELFSRMPRRNVVSWNSMVHGFGKCGDIVSARLLFDEMPSRNIVSWNSMISGYVHNGLPDGALCLFLRSQELGIDPDESTMVGVISAISDSGLLGWGKSTHGFITRCGFPVGGALGVSLITMYTRCGSVNIAHRVFSDIPNKNVAHWTSIIAGYAAHGLAEDSLQLFSEMLSSGVKPNRITFTSILNACSHGGLVEEGMKIFDLMRTYGIGPNLQHYGCLVDLLSRSGLVEEALELIGCLPGEPGPVVWGTLLAACRNHGNIVIAETMAHKLMELEPDYGGSYVLMSKMYASLGRWDDFSRTRKMMEENGVEKIPGFSWIEVDGDIHKFVMGDKLHPKHREMYNVLGGMERHLSWAGCRFASGTLSSDEIVDVEVWSNSFTIESFD